MASQLSQVLTRFAEQSAPLSLGQMAREMGIEPAILQGMIDYWVRKGKIREVSLTGKACGTCGIKGECPFVVDMPRSYELAREGDPPSAPSACCRGCCKT